MNQPLQDRRICRRKLLQALAAAGGIGLGGCTAPALRGSRPLRLAPLRASPDHIIDITVGLRPFRAAGPRLDTERILDTLVVHNYGHGGSGWSLSWGSSTLAVEKALTEASDRIAIIGCGVMGLTSAILAQAAGKKVTIYTKELIAQTSSARATGSFTPDSRIALTDAIGAGFPVLWEEMARSSLRRHLGFSGNAVRWIDRYVVLDQQGGPAPAPSPDQLDFVSFPGRLQDQFPQGEVLEAGETPFRDSRVRRRRVLMFDIARYAQMLMDQFLSAGGRFELRHFHHPAELAELPEKVAIHCTGYGARALWRDETVVPVRGQIAYLAPQPEFDYALAYRDVNVVPRSNGIVVQNVGGGDMRGYNEDSLVPDRDEAEAAVRTLSALYGRLRFG